MMSREQVYGLWFIERDGKKILQQKKLFLVETRDKGSSYECDVYEERWYDVPLEVEE